MFLPRFRCFSCEILPRLLHVLVFRVLKRLILTIVANVLISFYIRLLEVLHHHFHWCYYTVFWNNSDFLWKCRFLASLEKNQKYENKRSTPSYLAILAQEWSFVPRTFQVLFCLRIFVLTAPPLEMFFQIAIFINHCKDYNGSKIKAPGEQGVTEMKGTKITGQRN